MNWKWDQTKNRSHKHWCTFWNLSSLTIELDHAEFQGVLPKNTKLLETFLFFPLWGKFSKARNPSDYM